MKIKRALISVSDKTGVVELAKKLHAAGVEIVSTGGTMKAIKEAGIPVTYVSDVTGFPEICDGHIITDLQFFDISEVAGTAVTPMTRDHTVGVVTADGKAGLGHMSGTISHVLIGCAQVNGHFQIHSRNGNNTENLTAQTVIRKQKTGLLVVIFTG